MKYVLFFLSFTLYSAYMVGAGKIYEWRNTTSRIILLYDRRNENDLFLRVGIDFTAVALTASRVQMRHNCLSIVMQFGCKHGGSEFDYHVENELFSHPNMTNRGVEFSHSVLH